MKQGKKASGRRLCRRKRKKTLKPIMLKVVLVSYLLLEFRRFPKIG